jgi:hypothetical protein
MRLPDHLHERPFAEWNHLVRGVMEAWEVARLLGQEQEFEQQVMLDADEATIEHFGEVGNSSALDALERGRIEQVRLSEACPLLRSLQGRAIHSEAGP